jgi:hypothetical protein
LAGAAFDGFADSEVITVRPFNYTPVWALIFVVVVF